jgi:hypothetical protein
MDTTTPTTDIVIIDAEIVEDDETTFGKEIAKNTAYAGAGIGVVVLGVLAFNYLKPRIASLFSSSTETEPTAEETGTTETPDQD